VDYRGKKAEYKLSEVAINAMIDLDDKVYSAGTKLEKLTVASQLAKELLFALRMCADNLRALYFTSREERGISGL